MSTKIYLHLVMLYFFGKGIIATFSDNNKDASDLLVRNRRVISHLPERFHPIPIERAKFMVIIKKYNRANCAGAILSQHTVITAAHCVENDNTLYTVYSGAIFDQYSTIHNITWKKLHYGNAPHQQYDGIALFIVHPTFVFGQKTGNIHLYRGPLPEGTIVTVYGWGCNYPIQPGPPNFKRKLRFITIPIMNHEECKNIYRDHIREHSEQYVFDVTEKQICTFSTQEYCANGDAGAPLVVNRGLAGIHVWKGEFDGGRNPDVFVDIQRPEYYTWIMENTLII